MNDGALRNGWTVAQTNCHQPVDWDRDVYTRALSRTMQERSPLPEPEALPHGSVLRRRSASSQTVRAW